MNETPSPRPCLYAARLRDPHLPKRLADLLERTKEYV